MTDQELKDLVASLAVAQTKTEAAHDKFAAENAAGFAALPGEDGACGVATDAAH
jgi:hypothetical protein